MPAQIHILWTPAPVVSKVQFNQRLQFHQLFREAFQMIFLTQSVHSSEGGCWPRGIRRRKPITCWTKGWLRELLQCAESSTVQSGITATKNQEYHKNIQKHDTWIIKIKKQARLCNLMYVYACTCMHTYPAYIFWHDIEKNLRCTFRPSLVSLATSQDAERSKVWSCWSCPQ